MQWTSPNVQSSCFSIKCFTKTSQPLILTYLFFQMRLRNSSVPNLKVEMYSICLKGKFNVELLAKTPLDILNNVRIGMLSCLPFSSSSNITPIAQPYMTPSKLRRIAVNKNIIRFSKLVSISIAQNITAVYTNGTNNQIIQLDSNLAFR